MDNTCSSTVSIFHGAENGEELAKNGTDRTRESEAVAT